MRKAENPVHRTNGPYVNRELRHVILKMIILKRIKYSGRTYSYAILKDLSKLANLHFHINERDEIKNDVYNMMASLEKNGYIKMDREVSKGRVKKYYEITPSGEMVLASASKDFLRAIKAIKTLFR